jgi:hypothetical protein
MWRKAEDLACVSFGVSRNSEFGQKGETYILFLSCTKSIDLWQFTRQVLSSSLHHKLFTVFVTASLLACFNLVSIINPRQAAKSRLYLVEK